MVAFEDDETIVSKVMSEQKIRFKCIYLKCKQEEPCKCRTWMSGHHDTQ